jgi:hypothetical protein
MTRQFAMSTAFLIFFVLGSALECMSCEYWTTQPKAEQTCVGSGTEDCTTGSCYSSFATYDNGTHVYNRRCATRAAHCADPQKHCDDVIPIYNLTACVYVCCTTDYCNNYTINASNATGVKFSVSLMMIVGFSMLGLKYFAF